MIFGKCNTAFYNTWIEWFAWYPVELEDGRQVWLQKVRYMRKTINPHTLHHTIIYTLC